MQKENLLLVQGKIYQFFFPSGKCLCKVSNLDIKARSFDFQLFIVDFVSQLSLWLTLNRYLPIDLDLQKLFKLIVSFNEFLQV